MTKRDNSRLLGKLILVAVLMFGFGYALVPFYKKICEVTGNNSVLKADEPTNTQVDRSRTYRITFDASVAKDLAVQLIAPKEGLNLHPGALHQVEYVMQNLSQERLKVQAIPSYSPSPVAAHFKKLECFCFKQQILEPGETRKLPVVFVIDRDLPVGIVDVTLSYNLFKVAALQVEGKP
jgi:cytochrome c oxidase assembly protein subunit 11